MDVHLHNPEPGLVETFRKARRGAAFVTVRLFDTPSRSLVTIFLIDSDNARALADLFTTAGAVLDELRPVEPLDSTQVIA